MGRVSGGQAHVLACIGERTSNIKKMRRGGNEEHWSSDGMVTNRKMLREGASRSFFVPALPGLAEGPVGWVTYINSNSHEIPMSLIQQVIEWTSECMAQRPGVGE
jgi:hypothetical protein